ncbi:MAG: penicillin-binding protein activator [Pseudomonadota bacterium]
MTVKTLLTLILLTLQLCGCPRRVVINGVAVDYEDAARAAYDDAQQSQQAGRTDEALAKLDAFMLQFKDSDLADDALAALGDLALQQKEPERARDAFARLLFEHPQSEFASRARLELARIDVERGRPEDAVAPLRVAYEEIRDEDEKQKVALTLAETLEQGGQGAQAAEWYLKALARARDDAERERIQSRLFVLIDSSLGFKEIRLLGEQVDASSPVGELVQYKLARVYCHLRDYDQCSQALERYLKLHPRGRFVDPARAQADKLRARLTVNPTVVGVVLPLSGKYEIYGKRALWAIQAGAEVLEGQSKGGLTLVIKDSEGKPEKAAQAVEELTLNDHAAVILGAILQNTSHAAALKADELGVPLLSFSRREDLAGLGPYVFRYGLTNTKQALALVDLAMGKLGMTRFAILYPRHAYGMELMNAFWDEVDRRHGYVVAAEAYDHDETTFVAPIKRLVGRAPLHARGEYLNCAARARGLSTSYARRKALERCQTDLSPVVDFDALLIPDDSRAVGLIAPTLAFEDVLTTNDKSAIEDYRKTTGNRSAKPVQLLGANGWNDPTLIERGGKHMLGALFVDGFNPTSSEVQVQGFVAAFTQALGSKPTIIEAQAYDGGKLIAAIVRGGAQPAPRTRAEMRERLAQVRDFPGVTGLTRFDDKGDSVTPLTVFTIAKDVIEVADVDKKPEG